MNWKTGFFLMTALWLGTLVWAFYPGESSTDAEQPPLTRGEDAPCVMPPLEIACPTAGTDIAAYAGFISNAVLSCPSGDCGVDPSAVKGLDSKGFKIPKCELNQMLAEYTAAEEIWAMMALKEYDDPNGVYSHEVALMFQGEALPGEPEDCNIDGTTWKYFDFTLPCPTLCPGGGN